MTDSAGGVYLHVPFCYRVCPYCDFAVRTGDALRRARYVEHLCREIELYADWPLGFDTIYFGGGTPSLLAPEQLGRILDTLGRCLRLGAATRVFLEANPEDVTAERLREWRGLGVATLSLGVQSLEAASLELLGRRHGPQDARRAVRLAREAGFPTVSIDLIYGLPGQTPQAWSAELEQALALGADHLSCYQLTIHERTRFHLLEQRGRLAQLGPDEQAALFRLTHELLNASGMQGYEVSQFAAGPDHRSRHNLKYWDHTPYLGLGPSAHSFRGNERWWNVRNTDPWQERIGHGQRPVGGAERLEPEDLALEALMTGLRTYDGVDLGMLRARFGIELASRNRALVEHLATERLVALHGERLVPTLAGLAVADALAARFALA